MRKENTSTPLPGHFIETVRTFNAPLETVYRAWTEPEHLKNWWGPKGFTNTFHEFDLQPGGKWKFVMHGPEKGNYNNEVVFLKIDPFKELMWDRISNPIFLVNVLFEPIDDTTKVIFRMIFDTEEECNKVKKFVVPANEENFDKLEAELEKMK